MPKTKTCCDIVYYKHGEFGWSVYHKTDCYQLEQRWIPAWTDCAIVEDAPTRKAAAQEIAEMHILGVCLVKGA